MYAQRKDRPGDVMAAMVTVIVAVLGMTGILFSNFGPGNTSPGNGNARMITAAAVSRAGAIEIPSVPSAGQSTS